jgi:hypothetical protein
MSTVPRLSHVLALAAAVASCGILLNWIEWPQAGLAVEFSGLMLAAIVTSLPVLQPPNRDWPTLRLSFVVEFTSLMIFGAHPTMLVAGCGLLTRDLSDPQRSGRGRQRFARAATVVVSLQASDWAYRALGETLTPLVWPWHAAPIAAGVFVYCVVTSASADILVPLFGKRPIEGGWRWWPKRVLRECPVHVIAASVAVAFVELIDQHNWAMLAVTAAPLYLAYRGYSDYVNRLEQEHRRSEAIESLHDGVCILDRAGRVTL